MFKYLLQDSAENKSNIKGKIILFLFRLAQLVKKCPKPIYYFFMLYLVFYRVLVEWFLGIELPWNTQIGKGLQLFHGQSLVVNDGSIIGKYCVLRHNTTIGHKAAKNGGFTNCPVIGDYVDVGANVVIIGDVCIGSHVIIGAGSVVTKSLNGYGIYVGNPAKLLKKIDENTICS
jgi:putative colanic acid biosynthesis acetyltransferase WcaB